MVTLKNDFDVDHLTLIDFGQARPINDTSAEKTFEGADQNS